MLSTSVCVGSLQVRSIPATTSKNVNERATFPGRSSAFTSRLQQTPKTLSAQTGGSRRLIIMQYLYR